jgi:hypothetical protein
MRFLDLPKTEPGIPQAGIGKIVFRRGLDILFPLYVVPIRFPDQERILEEPQVFFQTSYKSIPSRQTKDRRDVFSHSK